MKQGNGEGWWWLAGLGLLASVWAGGATRAESLPDAWAFDLLARVEQWQSAGPLDVLPVAAREQPVPAATQARIQAGYGRLPLHFEPNIGQTAEAVHFVARGPGYTLFLTADEAVLALRPARPAAERADPRAHRRPFDFAARSPEATPAVPGAVLRTRLEGATLNPAPRPEGLDRQPGISNYLLGNDPAKWRTRVPHYARVRYPEVYPGIDLVYYGNPQRLEHDFIVAPGADPAVIRLAVRGAEEATVNAKGDLVLKVPGGEVVQQAPTIYQMIDGEQRAVAGRYVLREAAPGAGATVAVAAANPVPAPLQIGFEIARYDRTQPLVIDPALVYATYFSDSYSDGIAVDDAGHAYVTGDTASTDFPTTPDALQPSHGGSWDAFVAKLNANGTALVYATYLGGSGDDGGKGIAVDGAGHAYVTGSGTLRIWTTAFVAKLLTNPAQHTAGLYNP
ncbi:MAG: SBBP repeat-containing protein, partial [Candidatus Competibacteraceae bacterium]|nr:SBBP repeat-containing protein [Candidatus Competibacteraceae bacterium]